MASAEQTGFTPDFEAYVVAKAAALVQAGRTEHAAIREAMAWTLNLYVELAEGKTARAQAFHREATALVYAACRVSEC